MLIILFLIPQNKSPGLVYDKVSANDLDEGYKGFVTYRMEVFFFYLSKSLVYPLKWTYTNTNKQCDMVNILL